MMARFMAAVRAAQEGESFDITSMILHHLADSRELEMPWGVIHLPQWPPVHIGPITIDFSLTKHVVYMMLAALLVALLLIVAARDAKRAHAAGAGVGPKGAANVVEAFILYLRDEVALRNIGHGGERYVPYIVAVFFFVLFCNLLGLFPWGGSPTGNISVTAALAAMTFIMVEVAGMKALGAKGYAKTIFYVPEGLSPAMKIPMYLIMTPVELLGKLTKPFALAIRLYANMTAGHAVVLALTGLLILAAYASRLFIAPAPIIMAVAIMILEIFVAFLQAYIFAMLSAVFVGLIRQAH
ncbi:MAG: F0F1 ATP synthase subunit A [Longimicrobiales bacterium]